MKTNPRPRNFIRPKKQQVAGNNEVAVRVVHRRHNLQ